MNIDELNQIIAQLQSQIDKLNKEIKKLDTERNEIRTQKDKLRNESYSLYEQIEQVRAAKTQNALNSALGISTKISSIVQSIFRSSSNKQELEERKAAAISELEEKYNSIISQISQLDAEDRKISSSEQSLDTQLLRVQSRLSAYMVKRGNAFDTPHAQFVSRYRDDGKGKSEEESLEERKKAVRARKEEELKKALEEQGKAPIPAEEFEIYY